MDGVRSGEKPMGFVAFSEKYATEEICREALFRVRWPQGFECPVCGKHSYAILKSRNRIQCNACKHQTSPTVGTVMHKTRLPIRTWFWAIYLVAQDKRGISAMTLCKQLKVTYKTAWYLLHRIREAMGKRDGRYLLSGIVEFDDSYFGGPKGGGKRGRGTKKAKVLVAVSKTEDGKPQYLKMQVVPNLRGGTIGRFAADNIAENTLIQSDAAPNYRKALAEKWLHEYELADANSQTLAWLHIIVSNVKAFIQGTAHGLDSKHLQRYLDEACYRFNRRFHERDLFHNLLNAVAHSLPLGLDVLTG